MSQTATSSGSVTTTVTPISYAVINSYASTTTRSDCLKQVVTVTTSR
jgi:hypothetical protein